ncbi:MAG: MBL fold metallo-hydrolase, partial [Planctomycetes bacterium]|nr:MBL fold metallo-hydrolase [Planctomycetota bacterium]
MVRGGPILLILGAAQDGGVPHAGCRARCCEAAWADPARRRDPACAAIIDPATGRRWMIDCTPRFPEQLRRLEETSPRGDGAPLDGIFLTHAHVGHYAGLIHLGREAMGTRGVPVHAMPRMASFLRTQGPWGQLVSLGNVDLRPLEDGRAVPLSEGLSVTPFAVPHRGEYSETVGFRVAGSRCSALYLPDIDTWDRWDTPLGEALRGVDVAFLDGTFFDAGELPGRALAEVPHPLMRDTLLRLAPLPPVERAKVRFLHL